MQLNGAFVLREIMGDHVIVPIQSAESKFSGLITLNDAGVFLWSQLECVPDEETLCRKFYEAYEVDRDTAKKRRGRISAAAALMRHFKRRVT